MGRRASVEQRVDPIDMELTDAAKEGFGSHENDAPDNNMFAYDTADHHSRNGNGHDYESASLSDTFNEEHMIDILANVDCDIDEHMVVHEEDNWTKTIAGVAGNVLEW